MITFNKHIRSSQKEIMDSLDFQGTEMQNLLKDLKTVNKWLGGNRITLDGIEKLLTDHPRTKEVIILDIGCGDGQMLRNCSDLFKPRGYRTKFIGIDFNKNILEYAESLSVDYPNIQFKKLDVFFDEKLIPNCDIALLTLFLHHFSNENIEHLLKSILAKTTKGLVINDLHRSKSAFNLFKIVSKLFLKTKTAEHDGLVSISRGFKRRELEVISKKIKNQKSTIRWQWAFRFQWILEKNMEAKSR